MILSLAPMEGITGHVFRRVHAECFGALDCYYTPFLPPPRVGNRFGGKAFKEIDPANNQGLNVVPQLMSKNADEFVWAAQVLADMGYREVNLNLGCPSGTVVAKGKGSGFLRNLDELEVFLNDVCERSPLPVSVKTRLGLESDDEYERVLDLYCHMPLAELIVHPRVQKDRYTGSPRKEFYGETLERAPFPVAYNGDIFDLEDMEALVEAYPATRHVMLGRGEAGALEAETAALLEGDETYACLLTVPGIGPRTAAQLAVSVDIGRFPDHDHLASYCGIAPRVRSSGTSVRSVRASRRGDARLKSLLIFSCNSLVRSSGRYGEYYRACRARGMGHGRALKAVARKRLRAIYAVMRDRVPYRE